MFKLCNTMHSFFGSLVKQINDLNDSVLCLLNFSITTTWQTSDDFSSDYSTTKVQYFAIEIG